MGIKVEFNPDLALRDISEFKNGNREIEECVPEDLVAGKIYIFFKKGQRLFWLNDDPIWDQGQMPLCRTGGKEDLSRPLASIKMLEVTHFMKMGETWTKGKYKVIEVFDLSSDKIHFESCKRI